MKHIVKHPGVIRKAAKAKGLKLSQLGAAMNLDNDPSAKLSKILFGQRAISPDETVCLATALGKDLGDFAEEIFGERPAWANLRKPVICDHSWFDAVLELPLTTLSHVCILERRSISYCVKCKVTSEIAK